MFLVCHVSEQRVLCLAMGQSRNTARIGVFMLLEKANHLGIFIWSRNVIVPGVVKMIRL